MKVSKPIRVSRTYTQHLLAAPDVVFPLLCPVREADWIEGWDPTRVSSTSGVAERDCVFTTRAPPQDAVWYISEHDPKNGFVEMFKIVPESTACRISIRLRESQKGCEADITYTHTSLGPEGDRVVSEFSESYYGDFMQAWEARLNHFLTTGRCLTPSAENK